jgi:hypothetical protein
MAATTLADVIVPEIYRPYTVERTAELSAFWQSGIVAPVAELNLGDGGSLVQMPFWQDLAGDDQVISTTTNLTVAKIDSEKDVAVLNARALVYGAKDLAGALAGDDPLDAIGDLMADKWQRRFQALLIATLNGALGALAAESPAANTLDISALSGDAGVFDADSFIDAAGMLGDAEMKLQTFAIHSATMRKMKKLDLIDFMLDSEGAPTIPMYQGKRVIVDDGMPVAAGVYTSYLFGAGAIGYGEGDPKVPVEVERNALVGGGEEYLVHRRHVVLHPRGIKWAPVSGVPALDTPSNTELANTSNWARVYESKNIRIVRFKHRLA